MVVGGRHRHHLRHAQVASLRVGLRSRAGSAIAPVATIVPWPGISRGTLGDGADAARVRERDVRAHVVVGLQLVVARADHELVVAGDEVRESIVSAFLMHRHDERAGAVLALDVDGQAEADASGIDALRLALGLRVGVRPSPGCRAAAWTIAQAIRWVKESFLPARLERACGGESSVPTSRCGSGWRSGSSGSRS